MSNCIDLGIGKLEVSDEITKTGVFWTKKFIYDDDMTVSEPLEIGVHYIITNWQTRCEIKGLENGDFEIVENLGAKLEKGEEYLLIKPAY